MDAVDETQPAAGHVRDIRARRVSTQRIALAAAAAAVALIAILGFDLAVDSRAAALAREDSAAGQLLIPSRNLRVTIQPLVPSAAVQAQLGPESASAAVADGLLSAAAMAQLAANLEQAYPFSYEVAEPLTIPDELFNAERRQYSTGKLLKWLLKERDAASFRTVGVLSVDVYDAGYNYLFGQARLGGPGCVESTARMGHDLEQSALTAAERWHIVVRHELGHTLGLAHVDERESVMRFSNSLAELDASSPELSRGDKERLRALLPVSWQR